MYDQNETKIIKDAKFIQMVKLRNRFAVGLSLIVLVVYFVFIGIATFQPQFLARSFEHSVITIGIPVAAFIILFSWLITCIYIWMANQYFDRKKEKLKKEYQYE